MSLAARIAELIAAQGPISIAQYMTIALHDRDYGYYARHDPLGARGDFVTAPEISQMFGELLGLWCAQLWRDQGSPKGTNLVELGPGRGTLMADALRALRLMPEFLESANVILVESNPVLESIQRQTLAPTNVPIEWRPSFDRALAGAPLFLLANEFFDALPIRQFVRTERGWRERMIVANENGALDFALAPASADFVIPSDRGDAPVGGVYETSSAATALVQEIGDIIVSHGGGALLVDYGYDAPGYAETLQAVKSHAFADVLTAPGTQDLSAHVDFRALAQAATRGGAKACGPTGQGSFLTNLGIKARAARLDRGQGGDASLACDRLTDPDQMGMLFKVLAIVPKDYPLPPGFSC
jgi:NADH dehydrogenase [ubiquinone] 1 alpha subcomplex assembly factor 7